MEENQKTGAFKKLLDRLQEDSWQLELLISGFAIFGLFQALDFVMHQLRVAYLDDNTLFVNSYIIVHFCLQILIFNLMLHVLLRGLWIGGLGMRYVFGDIDFDQLNYSEQFTTYLKKNIGSFDTFIRKLENVCSVIFALTFLLIFYVISFFIIAFALLAFQTTVPNWMIPIVRFLFVVFSIGIVMTFFDFLTQGLLKKNKWVSKVYFPFYWVFSFLTLSFLYRPLVYNLLDNKLGKRISFALIPVYFIIYMVFHLDYQKSNFITTDIIKQSTASIANGRNYKDVIEGNDNVFIGEFAIQSKVITDPYLRIIVPINSKIEDELVEFNAKLKPGKDRRGLHFQPIVTFKVGEDSLEVLNEEYLNTFEKKYSFKIDTTSYATEFVISNINTKLAFESYIGIKDLTEGKHTIEFQSLENGNSDSLQSIRKIPFWYYKD